MTKEDEQTQDRSVIDRLADRRWTLSTSVIAITAVGWLGGAPTLSVIAGIAAVAAVTALAPPRSVPAQSRKIATDRNIGDMGTLSAAALASTVPDPLMIFDQAGVVVHANEAARQAFPGVTTSVDLQLRFRAPEIQTLIRRTLEGAVPESIDYAERVPLERLFRASASAIGEGSELYVLIFKDQSEARRIDRMRADFIANASHELRTPLATISGFIETLRGPARDDVAARDRFLGIMHSQTLRMARLIDDLLSLSRVEMRTSVAPGETVDLRLLVGSVIDSLNHLAAENGVIVQQRYPEGLIEVPGSRDELFQVFENLIENACKYGQSGGRVEVEVTRDTGGPKPEVHVAIRDFGPGIAEEHIPRITERFYRVDVETSRAQKGTGLGLSIVKHILTRHNARLSIRSKPGQGATFTVSLPSH